MFSSICIYIKRKHNFLKASKLLLSYENNVVIYLHFMQNLTLFFYEKNHFTLKFKLLISINVFCLQLNSN